MLYAIYCQDAERSASLRQAHYAAHRSHLQSDPEVRVLLAGPLLGEAGGDYAGSLIGVEAAALGIVVTFHQRDPFTTAGVWATSRITSFDPVTQLLASSAPAADAGTFQQRS